MEQSELMKHILAINNDPKLSDKEKAVKRQALMSGGWSAKAATDDNGSASEGDEAEDGEEAEGAMFDESLRCAMCMEMCVKPITAPCQHNFCLVCFNKWTAQGKKSCPTCRAPFPAKFASNPRINTALTVAIRMAKLGKPQKTAKPQTKVQDSDRPDEAFTTERAVRAGRANAASGRIMVTVPNDHFGPIPPEADPRGQGIRVGEFWKDRLDCRQWGAHFPHVAGIAGQSNQGAQSVVLAGGYIDDQDEGDWFLYTGSGGRDLSGNKRTNNVQSFDQTFDKMNKALLVSCQKGLPVRVVRSFKEKRSSYAPTDEQPVRYDGVYRIIRAYRKPGTQGLLVCRYVFKRCDNEPAPWSSEDTGDAQWEDSDALLPALIKEEMKKAQGGKVFKTAPDPWWGWKNGRWGWMRTPPVTQKSGGTGTRPNTSGKKLKRKVSEHEKALREFSCQVCSRTLEQPVSTPCNHNFCKPCLERKFADDAAARADAEAKALARAEAKAKKSGKEGGLLEAAPPPQRSMRERRVLKPCPVCKTDIADFLLTAQVNRGMMDVISELQAAMRKAEEEAAKLAAEAGAEAGADGDAGGEDDDDDGEEDEEGPAEDEAGPSQDPDEDKPAETEEEVAEQEEAAEALATASSAAQKSSPVQAGTASPAPQKSSPVQVAPASNIPPALASGLAELTRDFPDIDEGLRNVILQDQLADGGNIKDARVMLMRMRSQQEAEEKRAKAADRKAQKAIAMSPGEGPSQPAHKARATSFKKAAKKAAPAAAEDEAGPSEKEIVEPAHKEAPKAAAKKSVKTVAKSLSAANGSAQSSLTEPEKPLDSAPEEAFTNHEPLAKKGRKRATPKEAATEGEPAPAASAPKKGRKAAADKKAAASTDAGKALAAAVDGNTDADINGVDNGKAALDLKPVVASTAGVATNGVGDSKAEVNGNAVVDGKARADTNGADATKTVANSKAAGDGKGTAASGGRASKAATAAQKRKAESKEPGAASADSDDDAFVNPPGEAKAAVAEAPPPAAGSKRAKRPRAARA